MARIIVTYLYTIFYTNRVTGKLDWEQITCHLTVEGVKEKFEEMYVDKPVDYSQPIVIIPGWLTPEQSEALFNGPKATLGGKKLHE